MLAAMCLLVLTGSTAGAQGGLIKKKLGDALKKKVEPAKTADAAATTAQASNEPTFPFEFTPQAMASFKAGIQLEARRRDEYRSTLAKAATWKKCSEQTMASPAGMKVMEEYQKKAEGVKAPDDMVKLSQWLDTQMKGVARKACGEDPGANLPQQYQAFQDAERAGAIEFGKGWTQHSAKDEESASEAAPTAPPSNDPLDEPGAIAPSVTGGSCAATAEGRESTVAIRPDTASDDDKQREYRRLKELLEAYCRLTAEQKQQARDNGLRIQGSGPGIWWVFSRGFAVWAGDDCDDLLRLFKLVGG
ncbi:MAG: hypothetical protein U0163_04290 [Gemmatimonadaceae bacterium]